MTEGKGMFGRKLGPGAVLAAMACLCAPAAASWYVPKPHQACRADYRRVLVRVRERHPVRVDGHIAMWFVRRHGKVVWTDEPRCVSVPSATTTAPTPTPPVTVPTPPDGGTTPPVTTPSPTPPPPSTPPTVRASLDPSYTQDASDALKVTWSYDAGVDNGTLPAGNLSLTVYQHGQVGSAGGCSIPVGGSVTGGNCTVELPQYGSYDVTVSYFGSDSAVSPNTSTETEQIEPLPATVQYRWGTDQGTANPSITATVIGQTASTTLSDQSFEGASAVTLTDNLGDGCSATVSGSTASCQMPVTGTPSAYTVSYRGGTSTTGTRSVPPNGVQQVTYQWPSEVVRVPSPSVTVQQASVEECGGSVTNLTPNPWPNDQASCSYGSPTPWPNPVQVTTTAWTTLFVTVYGSLPSDRDPTHGGGFVSGYLVFNVSGPQGATWYANDTQGSSPDNSSDCSHVLTQQYFVNSGTYGPDEPVGGCQLRFPTAGQYTVTVSYVSEDANYASVSNVDSETVWVS